jgi:hypothetical protein
VNTLTAKVCLVATLLGTPALLAAAPASAHVFTIRGDWKMGRFEINRDGTLAGAIAAFGEPTARDRRRNRCTVRWSRHGLRMVFRNRGENPCRAASGNFSKARAKGPHWRTGRGLERGDRDSRLRKLYPNAAFRPAGSSRAAGWWLVRSGVRPGTRHGYSGLLAEMKWKRVRAFHIRS